MEIYEIMDMLKTDLLIIDNIYDKPVYIKIIRDYYCGYIEKENTLDDPFNFDFTYDNNVFVGVDTTHSWNYPMTLEEKYKDCLEQLKRGIKKE